MFKVKTDIVRKAVYMGVIEVYNGDDSLFETSLRLTATEMIVETGRAYVVSTKRAENTYYHVYGYLSDVDLAVDGADSNVVIEVTKCDYGYQVEDISYMFD